MAKSRIIILILLILGLYSSIYLPISVLGDSISTVAEKDTYVAEYYPSKNFGDISMLEIGVYLQQLFIPPYREAYLYFNFSDKPEGWTKAEISIDMYEISETFDVTISLITDDWQEMEITWSNKPEHNEIITTFTVSSAKIYKFDVTNYIAGRENISICINASDYQQTSYVKASSRESYQSDEDAPQLIWTETTSPSISGFQILPVLLSVSFGIIALAFVIRKRRILTEFRFLN